MKHYEDFTVHSWCGRPATNVTTSHNDEILQVFFSRQHQRNTIICGEKLEELTSEHNKYNEKSHHKQECIPVGCAPPALYRMGGLPKMGALCPWGCLSRGGSPWQRPPPPPEATWDLRQRPPRRNMGPVSQTGSDIVTSYRDPSPCGQTDTCKNITLPQTSFAGGKNKQEGISVECQATARHSPHFIVNKFEHGWREGQGPGPCTVKLNKFEDVQGS